MAQDTGGEGHGRIFAPSSLAIDDSKLCFNKTHFGREDFDVQRFMNLTRRRANLKQIQTDLRLYLKSLQHSMIELINDDYADFVHLSSNLVGLNNAIEKIDKDIQTIWSDFTASTQDAVGVAEKIESRCNELTANRNIQAALRDRISFISALQQLNRILQKDSEPTIIWLEKISSYIADISAYPMERINENPIELATYQKVTAALEKILCTVGVKSAAGDCALLPLVHSILSLIGFSSSLTASLVADLIQPNLVSKEPDLHKLLVNVCAGVNEYREKWSNLLGKRYRGELRGFLHQTLLTFFLTFIDRCLNTVAVPSDTKLFHKCYVTIQQFISDWPCDNASVSTLKQIRDKFNLLVYFKLETYKIIKKIDSSLDPQAFAVSSTSSNAECQCEVSTLVVNAIEYIWSEDVFLTPLMDKLWDTTLRLLSKHLAWVRAVKEHFSYKENRELAGLPAWEVLLKVRADALLVHSTVFDLAIELIWTKIREIGVDSSLFGQCLTRFGASVDAECKLIDEKILEIFSDHVCKDMEGVCEIPKQYRWTKKQPPSTHSAYVNTAHSSMGSFADTVRTAEHPGAESMHARVHESAYRHFILKANEVLNSVEVTGSSLSRFKRTAATADGSTSDDEKIKTQIYRDAQFCLERAQADGLSVVVDELSALCKRSCPDHLKGSTSSTSLTSLDTNANNKVNGDSVAVPAVPSESAPSVLKEVESDTLDIVTSKSNES